MESPAKLTGNRLVIAGIFVAALIPLFATPVLPFIDFYNHIARYFVLANIDNNALLQQNYQSNWSILPNIGLDIIVTGLMKLLPHPVIPRLVIIMIFAVQYGGILYFNRALTGRLSAVVALLTIPLLYSFILNWGFANFLLGLGLVFWGAGWWLQQRHRLIVALPVAMVIGTLIFLVHGLSFALYGILLGSLEIGIFFTNRDRRFSNLLLAMIPLTAQAIVPILLFSKTATVNAAGGITNADESVIKLKQAGRLSSRLWELLQYRLTTIARVAEGPSLAFDVITLLATLAILVLLLQRGRAFIAPVAWPALLVAAVLIVVVPPGMFAVGYVSDRIPLFLAMLTVAAFGLRMQNARFDRVIVAALVLLVVVRLAWITLDWQAYNRDNADFAKVAAALPSGALVETLVVGGERLDYERRRCQMYAALLIIDYNTVGRLFASVTAQPLSLAGPLARVMHAEPVRDPGLRKLPGWFDDSIEIAATAGVPWMLLCDQDRLTRPLPAYVTPVAIAGRFSVVRLRKPVTQPAA